MILQLLIAQALNIHPSQVTFQMLQYARILGWRVLFNHRERMDSNEVIEFLKPLMVRKFGKF